jgi:hypothetical protein
MVNKISNNWFKYLEVNNTEFEVIKFKDSKILIIKDFLKYPDKFRELLDGFIYFNEVFGSTFKFHKTYNYYAEDLVNVLSNIFNTEVKAESMRINCFNGNSKPFLNFPHGIPHVDLNAFLDPDLNLNEQIMSGINISTNIGLTEDLIGGTSFWSYNNKTKVTEMSKDEINQFLHQTILSSELKLENWIENPEESKFKLEFLCPLDYNTFTIYPSFNIHSPYLKSEWYNSTDRISLATFFNVKTSSIDPLQNF